MSYQVNPINESIIQILDSHNDTIYIIKGSKHSLVFDLGMDEEPIKPLLDSLISTPYDVVVSHGHFDHVGRSGEFEEIHMNLNDLDLYKANELLHEGNGLSYIKIDAIKEVKEVYDLGDRSIHVIPCFGHTPGSILLVDVKNKVVLTGDAIGSGCGVWMQVDFALSLTDYASSLEKSIHTLKQLGVDASWLFLGGHARQEYYSKVSSYNPISLELMGDMLALCHLLLDHKVCYESSDAREFSTGKPHYASYKKAEMIFTLNQC